MKTTKKYWKGLAQLNDDPIVEKLAQNEFVEDLPVDQFLGDKKNLSSTNSSRRDFLKFLGFSTAAATLAACETPVVKSIPYLVDKTKGVKLLQLKPFSGKLDTVINSASKLFVNQLSSRIDSNTELYNSLVILQNLVSGAESNSIVDKKGLDFKVWEVLEAFTVGVYFA